MNLPSDGKRRWLLATAAAALACAALPASAQAFPDRPVKLVVPFGAGGSTDALARLLAQRLSERMQQPVTVENKAGAAGAIGADAVAKSAGDGYTLLVATSSTHAVLPQLRKLPYDALRDFTPVAFLGSAPNVLVASPALGVNSIQELLASPRARAGKLVFSSSGNGAVTHLIAEAFLQRAGITATHVPYKTGVQALPDLASGQVDFAFDSIVWTLPQSRAGKVRALAIASKERSALAPELPTVHESGFPGFDGTTWFGVMAPAGLPPAITTELNRRINEVLADPAVRKAFEAQGAEPQPMSAAAFAARVRADGARWAEVVAKGNIKIEQ